MTMRLSMSSFAGIARTLVAVGTSRLVSMLITVRAAAPRRRCTSTSEPAVGRVACAGGTSRGSGAGAGVGGRLRGRTRAGGGACRGGRGRRLRGAGVGCRPVLPGRCGGGVLTAVFSAAVVSGVVFSGTVAGGGRAGGLSPPPAESAAAAAAAPSVHLSGRPRRPSDAASLVPALEDSARTASRTAGSPRRTPTRPGPPSSCPPGTAGAARRRATRWDRTPCGRVCAATRRGSPSSTACETSGWYFHPN